MNLKRLFIRNVRARPQLELFLLSGIVSLLSVRYYLYLTGYPQVGGDTLHIAHMLWGGALMLSSLILLLAFLGRRLHRFAAFLGGAGFGVFIDEIGKFITKDNNYFFRPAIGIIYAIFVALVLLINFLSRERRLGAEEAQLNALNQLEEAVLRDMDPAEKRQVADLLAQADQSSLLTKRLQEYLKQAETVAQAAPNYGERVYARLRSGYDWLWQQRGSNGLVQTFFIVEVAFFMAAVLYAVAGDFDGVVAFFQGKTDYGHWLVIGQLVSSAVALGFALVGVARLTRSRLEAFEWFRRSVFINLLLTDFFIFSRVEFQAIGGFAFNIALLLVINFVLNAERQRDTKARPQS